MNRPTHDQHFMRRAMLNREMSTCARLQVGASIVNIDGHEVSNGRNGAPRGLPHGIDNENGCELEENHDIQCIHAELNAILQAARVGISVNDCTMYVTHRPCARCALAIVQVGIWRVFYMYSYDNDEVDRIYRYFHQGKVELIKMELPEWHTHVALNLDKGLEILS